MKNTEGTLLACFLIEPSLLQYGLDDLFQFKHHQLIYSAMVRLKDFDLPILADSLSGIVPVSEIFQLYAYRIHTKPEFIAKDVSQCITRLKQEKQKNKILNEIKAQLGGQVIDFSPLRELVLSYDENIKDEGTIDNHINSLIEIKEGGDTFEIGYPSIDNAIGGFRKGELCLIMGRTTTGKTWILLNILKHIALMPEENIGLFSLEMPGCSIMERLLQLYFMKSREEISKDFLVQPNLEMQTFRDGFSQVKIFTQIYSPQEIRRKIKTLKLRVILIDFLGMLKTGRFYSSYERTTEIVTELKQIAKEEGVLIILAHQLSRQAEDGAIPVKLNHARDSGVCEELSDFVLGIWRPEISSDNVLAKDKIYVHLLKNKRGEPKCVECHFDKRTGRILELEVGKYE